MKRFLRDQWLLILVLGALTVIGSWAAITGTNTWSDLKFNLGVELLGSAVSIFFVDIIVSRYLDRREQARRRPLLRVVVRRLGELLDKAADDLVIINLYISYNNKNISEIMNILTLEKL